MSDLDLSVEDIRVFVPAKDFALSKRFYAALGWGVEFDDGNLALLELGGHRFYLQDFYREAWAQNFRLHVSVDSAADWHTHVTHVLKGHDFAEARTAKPRLEPFGALVTYVWDPSGVLLDFAEWLETEPGK